MLGLITLWKIKKYEGWTPQGIGKSWGLDVFFMGISVKASGPSMMGQKVAAEVAKAQLLHSKGGALSKTTTCVSWIAFTTNHRTAFDQFFLPVTTFYKQDPIQPWFLVDKIVAAPHSNWFRKMPWGSPAWNVVPIPPKAELSLKDLHLNSDFSSSKKAGGARTNKQKHMNAHEHPWETMSTQENPWIHMYSCDVLMFFRTNAAGKLYVQPLFIQFLI